VTDRQYVCVATRLRVRGPRVLPSFLAASARVRGVARSSSGNVRTRLLGMPPFPVYFTLTVWESHDAMRAFVLTAEHRQAIAMMEAVARAGTFVEFTSPTPKVGWRTAMRHLRSTAAVRHQPA